MRFFDSSSTDAEESEQTESEKSTDSEINELKDLSYFYLSETVSKMKAKA